MGIKYFFVLITIMALTTGLYSCQKEDLNNSNEQIIGTWVFDTYLIDSDFEVFTAKEELDADRHGIIFQPEGKLIIRNIDGWCATPPVSYQNFNGTWEKLSDSTIFMRYEWWGSGTGQAQLERTFQIIQVDDQQLWIKYIF